MVYQDVIFCDEINEKVKNVANMLRNVDRNVCESSLLLKDDKLNFITKILSLSNIPWKDKTERLIYDIIIDHCQKAERAGPGSFVPTVRLILESLENNKFIDEKSLDDALSKSYRPTFEQTLNILKEFVNNDFMLSLFKDVLQISGIEGKVVFESSPNDNTVVELTNGFNFRVEFPFQVSLQKKDVRVLIIDGNIESVGEIHNVLQRSLEMKDTLVIVARGFHPDVVNTLKVNFHRQTLSVIPVVVKYDFDGINEINDIAITSCSDVISSMKGQLISAIKYDEIKIVPYVECQGKILTIVNNSAIKSAEIQVKSLVEKRYEASVDQLASSIDERIKSLTPNCVRVKIPKDENYVMFSEKFDTCLRILKSIIRFGCINVDDTQFLNKNFSKITTVESVLSSVKFANCCCKMLTDSTVFVMNV